MRASFLPFAVIDPRKVLVVVNENDSRSREDAEWYCARRCIPSNNIVSFAFGLTNLMTRAALAAVLCVSGVYSGQTFFRAVSNWVTDNQAQGVICSTYTPAKVLPELTARPLAVYTLASFAGTARFWRNTGIPSALPPDYFDEPNYCGIVSPDTHQTASFFPWTRRSPTNIPHGRLGNPNFISSTAINEFSVRASITSSSCVQYATNTAIAVEGSAYRSKLHALTTHLDYAPYQTALDNAKTFEQFANSNFSMLDLNSANVVLTGEGQLNLPAPFFSAINGANFNVDVTNVGGQLADSFSCVPGAICYFWCSSAGVIAANALFNGASAAVATFGEPYADGIPLATQLIMILRVFKSSMMLAHHWSRGNSMGSTVIGDPLYQPYLAT